MNDVYRIYFEGLKNGRDFNHREKPFVGPLTGRTYAFRPDYYRDLYPRRIHILSEGILVDPESMHERADWPQEQKAWRISALYWDRIHQRPWFCGGAMWALHDTVSPWGATDIHHLPKELFHFYSAMGSRASVLHILGHWNHNLGDLREIVVFTNCSDVELTLNGRSLGTGGSVADEFSAIPSPPRIWRDVPFEAGVLRVTGRRGDVELFDERVTAGAADYTQLTARPDRILADGRDIAYVDIVVCDADGNRCFTWDGQATMAVAGVARLAGPSKISLRGGISRVAIQSDGEPGSIIITARADGIWEGSAQVLAE